MSVGVVNKTTGDRIPTAGMPAIDSVLSGTSTNPVQNRVVKAALDEKADTDIVASDFDATASYTAGNYCIYEGKFYRFKNNHSGAWSAADVDEIKIAGELSSIKSGLIVQTITDAITPDTGVTLPSGSAIQKMGVIVVVNAVFQKDLVLGKWNTLGTVGSGYRPPRALSFAGVNPSKDTTLEAKIDSAGVISVWPTSANSDAVVSNISVYIVYFNS